MKINQLSRNSIYFTLLYLQKYTMIAENGRKMTACVKTVSDEGWERWALSTPEFNGFFPWIVPILMDYTQESLFWIWYMKSKGNISWNRLSSTVLNGWLKTGFLLACMCVLLYVRGEVIENHRASNGAQLLNFVHWKKGYFECIFKAKTRLIYMNIQW